MDALVAVALEEVAAEGERGCSLPELWKWLEAASMRSGLLLDPALKQALWKLLLSRSCLSFKDPSFSPLASLSPLIQAYQNAEQLSIRIVASEDLRDSFLGVYAIRHSDSKLSTEQRRMLERIGRARANGITQYEIGKEFGVSGNKLFYVIKNLESRGLLVRQSSIFRGERPISTNLIHLKRFAKSVKLGSQQRFEIQKTGIDHGKGGAKATEGSKVEGNIKGVLVSDDLPALKAICKKLEEAPKKVLVIADLKVNLGYRLTRGHREWRRLLGRLVGAGMVEVFEAKVENKILPCLRLLKAFDLKAFHNKDNRTSSEQVESDRSTRGAKRGQVTEQVAELSLNRQIYEIINQGGAEGVPVTKIFSSLGLNNRKNYYRFSDMIPKHGLNLKVENHKRSTQYRVCMPVDTACVQPDLKERSETRDTFKDSKGKVVNQSSLESNTAMDSSAADCFKQAAEGAWLGENFVLEDQNNAPDETPSVVGLEMVPYTQDEHLESIEQIPMPVANVQSSAAIVLLNDTSSIALSVSSQRTVALSSAHTQREVWIMERLERESFVLRSELHKWLEELECRTNSILDRKTVIRNLQRLQKQGRCKCILVSLPGVTNYGQMRTVDVVLLPSVEVNPELLSKIYERQRSFDMQIRTQGVCRRKKIKADLQVPTMNGLMRMPKTEVLDKGGTLQDNGFICAKLVRCRMLHRFFWLYVTGHIDNNNHVKAVSDHPSTTSSAVFSLLAAVQSMPLELFLQVIGSAKHIKGLTECCRRGMKLSDLPTRESEALLDINASGRVAWLVDILRRLKLLRIVMIPAAADVVPCKQPQIGVAYALELKPHIDEPGLDPPTSISAHFLNSGPAPRHFFDLSSLENLEDYWGTLEYFFRGSNSASARRIFPASTVPELLGARSWSSLRVMSMDQRIELQKRINADNTKRLHYEECVRIAQELNLSLDQVLNASYEKNQRIKLQKICSDEPDPFNTEEINISLGKTNPAPFDGIVGSTSLEITKIKKSEEYLGSSCAQDPPMDEPQEAGKIKQASLGQTDETHEGVDSGPAEVRVTKKFRPFRKRKFPWKDGLDRVLLACYTRQRAFLGARYNRVEWSTIPGLPAPPAACRRRVAFLKMIPPVRRAIVALCNLLGRRYTKFLCSKAKAAQSKGVTDFQNSFSCADSYGWDDFKDPILSAAVNDIILCKKAGRSSPSKKVEEALSIEEKSLRMLSLCVSDLSNNNITLQPENIGNPCVQGGQFSNEMVANTRIAVSARMRPNRSHMRKHLQRPPRLSHLSSTYLVQNSLGAAVAVELIKLVFLDSAVESQVSEILVQALRRCKEFDVFTAFRFLKEQGMVASGDSGFAFVLSPKFFQNAGFSPFAPSTAEECKRFEAWLKDMRSSLEQDWAALKPEIEWGEIFSLFSAVSNGTLSIAPFLPEKGIGEKENEDTGRKRKRDVSHMEDDSRAQKMRVGGGSEKSGFNERRERGFPHIEVKVCASMMPLEDLLTIDGFNESCSEVPVQIEDSPLKCGDLSQTNQNLDLIPLKKNDLNCEPYNSIGVNVPESNVYSGTIQTCEVADYIQDSYQMPQLKKAFNALAIAGEEGLRIEELAKSLDADDDNEAAYECFAKLLHSGHAKEVMAFDHTRLVLPPYNERFFLHLPTPGEEFGAVEMVPILPWLEASGKENEFMRKSLCRRVMGIVMLNPGILEDSITEQVDVLNPTSCRKLLELMVLDGHLYVRVRKEYGATLMPKLLERAYPQKRQRVTRRHFYANPASSCLL